MRWLAVCSAACLVVGCGDAGVAELEIDRDLDVAGVTVTDVFAPAGGEDLPVVVMLHGTGGEPEAMEPLARAVAAEGAVVYVPSWPVIDEVSPTSDDEPFRRQAEAVVCALRFARRTAPDHGGDPDTLTLVGHSGGATTGARAALVATPPWPGIDCDPEVSHRPVRFVATGGDFFGVYQYASECADLYGPYDPFAIEPSNADVEVRLIHGFHDTAVDVRASLLFDRYLLDCGLDAAVVATDTGHSALRDPSSPAGAFVVDQVVALVHGRESVFERSASAALVEFGEDGTCRYDGPSSVPVGEPVSFEIRNETVADLQWFALVRLRPDVPVTLDDLRADATSSGGRPPSFVSDGGFLSVPAGTSEELTWVFVDGDADWALYCMPDPDPAHPMKSPSMWLWAGPVFDPAAIVQPAGRDVADRRD